MSKYSFRVNSSDDPRVVEILSTLQGKERTSFIKKALVFYVRNEEVFNKLANDLEEIQKTIKNLSSDVAEIKEMLKKEPGSIGLNKPFEYQEPGNSRKKKNNEEILKELVNDFLNM